MTSDEWDAAEREIVALWSAGDGQSAIAHIEAVLSDDRGEFRGRALMYRGSIYEAQEQWKAAKDDFSEAVRLFDVGSYVRYTAELSLGQVCRMLGEPKNATDWYRAALQTCDSAIEPISGSSALAGFLSLKPLPSPVELTLIRTVITKSWKLLDVAGSLDVTDLKAATAVLKSYETEPR